MFSSITKCTTTRTLKLFFQKNNSLNISGSNLKGVASHSTLSVAQYHTGSYLILSSRLTFFPRGCGLIVAEDLAANVFFVFQILVHQIGLCGECFQNFRQRLVLMQALHKELRMSMKRAGRFLRLEGSIASINPTKNATFSFSIATKKILTWSCIVAVIAVRTVGTNSHTEKMFIGQ